MLQCLILTGFYTAVYFNAPQYITASQIMFKR